MHNLLEPRLHLRWQEIHLHVEYLASPCKYRKQIFGSRVRDLPFLPINSTATILKTWVAETSCSDVDVCLSSSVALSDGAGVIWHLSDFDKEELLSDDCDVMLMYWSLLFSPDRSSVVRSSASGFIFASDVFGMNVMVSAV